MKYFQYFWAWNAHHTYHREVQEEDEGGFIHMPTM